MAKDMDSGAIPIVPAKFVATSNGVQLGELFAGGKLTQWDGTGWVNWEHVQDYLEEYSARAYNSLTYLEDIALTLSTQLNMQVVCTAVQPTAPAPAPVMEPKKSKGKKTETAAVAEVVPAPFPAPAPVDAIAQAQTAAAAASAAMAAFVMSPIPVPTPTPAPTQCTLPGIVPDIDTAVSNLCAAHGLNAVGVALVRHLDKSAAALDQVGLSQLAKDFRISAAAIRGTITFGFPS